MGRGGRPGSVRGLAGGLLGLTLLATSPAAQTHTPAADATFRFSAEAGQAVRALWDTSLAAQQERVACLKASVGNDTVLVTGILPLEPVEADSMGTSATASIERCGPPGWSGTIHTHVALYTDERPSTRFSGQDRVVMRMWYDRWHADGVFCVVYSDRDARCEADGVVGGVRSRPERS